MRKILLFTTFLFITIASFSQDLISLKSGKRLEVIVTEITPTLIRYKLFTEPQGKTYFVYKDDVTGIMYRDGRIETFERSGEQMTESAPIENENRQSSSIYSNFENSRTVNQSINNRNQTNDFILSDGTRDIIYLKNGSVIRGTIVEQVPYRSIKIETADGSLFVYQMDEIEKIAKETTRKNNKPTQSSGLKRGYKGIVDLGYYFGVGDYSVDRLNFNFINGYQVNPYFSFGVGTGVHYYLASGGGDDQVLIPFFADLRVNFINKAVSPYLSFDIGYSFNASDSFDGVGIFISPTIGVSYKIPEGCEIHAGIGFQMQRVNYDVYDDYYGDYYYSSHIDMSAIAVKIGLSF